jgi:hypothetical protein
VIVTSSEMKTSYNAISGKDGSLGTFSGFSDSVRLAS